MKFNMVCVKFDQKKPKNLNFRTFQVFLNLKNLGFFGAIFQPCLHLLCNKSTTNNVSNY